MSPESPLQAPEQNGALLAVPPLERCRALLEQNVRRLDHQGAIAGRPLVELRRDARRSLLEEAIAYLRQAGEPVPSTDGQHVLMAGHQPELFHPGVWLKNFALMALARRHGAIAVNLIVDSDTMKTAHLRVPAPADERSPFPYRRAVPYDDWQGEVPYEMCSVRDQAEFAGFADRVGQIMGEWRLDMMLPGFWQTVMRQSSRTDLIGERFVAARRAVERSWGCHNFEVPLSRLCRTEPFARLACHLLEQLPRLHATYNECVRAHRKRHGIRSRNHPVPDLASDGDWLEVPLWAWRAGERQRGRLFARHRGGRIELRTRNDTWPSLPARSEDAIGVLLELFGAGFALRTRALLTAMFSRLLLGDLFMHGIGGAKYDELTDRIIQRFFGIEPPHFLALSGTLYLPLPAYPVSAADRDRMAHELRDLRFNPQRHLPEQAAPQLLGLARHKEALARSRPNTRDELRQRHHALRDLNRRMAPYFEERRRGLRQEMQALDMELRSNRVLRRRDYAFCLYPEKVLRPWFESVVEGIGMSRDR